jgi:hypothetical protein
MSHFRVIRLAIYGIVFAVVAGPIAVRYWTLARVVVEACSIACHSEDSGARVIPFWPVSKHALKLKYWRDRGVDPLVARVMAIMTAAANKAVAMATMYFWCLRRERFPPVLLAVRPRSSGRGFVILDVALSVIACLVVLGP